MMRIRLLLLSILVTGLNQIASGQVVYGLKDCIKTGLERNFSLLITRNSETVAKNNYTPGNAGFLPSLDLTGRYSGTLNDTKQNLSDGTQIVSTGVFNTTANAGLVLGMTIFNGFNVQTTYKRLGELKQLGELNTQYSIENLVGNIVSGYFDYIQQVQNYKNLEYAITLSKERLRIDEERFMLGSSSKLQVLQSRVYLNSDSSNLTKQFEVLRSAQIRLNELLAVEDLGVQFATQDTVIDVNEMLLFEKLLEETLAKNTSLLIASANRTLSEYDYKLVVSRSYPYLNLSSGYSYNYNTYSPGATRNQITDGFNYGLTFGISLFDGMNQRRSIRNSSLELKNKELRYLEVEQGVKADLITIYNGYRNNLRLINLEKQNLETATENLDIALERYKLGELSGIDLREVQKSLLDAKDRLLLVQYQTKIAEISLLLISGRIMDYYQ